MRLTTRGWVLVCMVAGLLGGLGVIWAGWAGGAFTLAVFAVLSVIGVEVRRENERELTRRTRRVAQARAGAEIVERAAQDDWRDTCRMMGWPYP